MSQREYLDYIHDILDALNAGIGFIEKMDFNQFSKDKKTQFAVVRSIEILGEAVKNIPKSIKSKYPDIPWNEMIGMRNKLIHEYFGVDLNVLWETVQVDFPQLKKQINYLLKEIENK